MLDITPSPAALTTNQFGVGFGYFYRVVNVTDLGTDALGNGQVGLELQTNLRNNVTAMAVMEDVVEVIDKGVGWQP